MKTPISFLLGAIAGMAGMLAWQNYPAHEDAEVAPIRDLPGQFGSTFGMEGPPTARWREIHSNGDYRFWAADDLAALAVSNSNDAVLMFSYIEDIKYYDIFENGDPRVTVELATDEKSLFVYADAGGDNSWVYIDNGIDGRPEKRLIPGSENSIENLEVINLTAKSEN